MTEPETVEIPEKEITFRGRSMWVRFPDPNRLLIWQRTLTRLQNLDENTTSLDQVMPMLERIRGLIDSILVNKIDIEWLDDEMLAGRVTVLNLPEIVNDAVKAYGADNRETRRTAKKAPAAKKAVRKAVTR